MMEWQWHQLDYMQIICTSLQVDNHASTSPFIFTGRMPFLPPNQQHQGTEGNQSTEGTEVAIGAWFMSGPLLFLDPIFPSSTVFSSEGQDLAV